MTRWIEKFSNQRGWRPRLAVMLALLVFYALTAAGNLSEADDALAFAYRVEHISAAHTSDPRLLVYHVLARNLWLMAQTVGLPLGGLDVLRGISLLTAPLCLWWVWRLLVQRLAVPRAAALGATALLGLSYGFWRYAVEGDVYAPAMWMCAALLHALLAPKGSLWRAAGLGALGGVAVLFYQPNAIPLFLSFPLLVVWRWGWRAALMYVAAGAAAGLAGYLAAFVVYWPDPLGLRSFLAFLAQRSQEFTVPPLSLRVVVSSVAKSAVALGHDLASTNWAFGFSPLETLARKLFGDHELDEEVYLARYAGGWIYGSLLTLPLVALAAWRLLRSAGLPAWPGRADTRSQAMATLALWAGLTALVIGRLNPTGVEAWIVFLLPMMLLAGVLVFQPSFQRHGVGPALALVLALAAHNTVGGMWLVHQPASDLIHLRSDWLARNAQDTDLIVVVDDVQVADRLRYHSRAEVTMIRSFHATRLALGLGLGRPPDAYAPSHGREYAGREVVAMARRVVARGGRVLVYDKLFVPGPSYGLEDPTVATDLATVQQRSVALHRTPDGLTVYALSVKKDVP